MEIVNIETLANLSLPFWAIPYSLLCLFTAILGLFAFVSGNTVKKLRNLENESQKNIKKLEAQHERDSLLQLELKEQIDHLRELSAEDDNTLSNPP